MRCKATFTWIYEKITSCEINVSFDSPRENKTIIRFVTDLLRKYIGLTNLIDNEAKINPIYFHSQSVRNLISNSIQ